MKKKVIAALSCGVLMMAVAGCGSYQTGSTDTLAEGTVSEESGGEAAYDVNNGGGDIVIDVDNLSESQQHMFGPMGALIYCYESDSETDHKWEEAGWGTLSTLANDFYTMEDAGERAYGDANDRYLILGSFLKECASAMYADFDGELPPIPPSDQIVDWGIQGEQGEYYKFLYGDRGMDTHDFYITAWIEHADGTCAVEMQEWGWDPDSLLAIYDIELVGNEYTASQTDPYFIYSVASINKNDEKTEAWLSGQTAADNDYILPESDIRYYTESELSGLTNDELRLARNEIYARHGRKFDSEDLQQYFDGQVWYDGTIEPSDFSDSMLNDYEKANIQVIESLENSTGQSTTYAAVPSEFSFADLAGRTLVSSSGAGGWADELTVQADGTFSGVYYNHYGGDESSGTPESYYWSEYTGKLSTPTKVNSYTYSTTVESVELVHEPDTEEMIDGILYQYEDESLEIGEEITIYLPGAPAGELPDDVLSWLYGVGKEDTLPYYVLNAPYTGVFYG